MSAERGQATVEFAALLMLCCLAFGALLSLSGGLEGRPVGGLEGRLSGGLEGRPEGGFDGRSIGGFLARHFTCAAGGRCERDERGLVDAYGERDAAAVRALAPSLVYEPGERQLPVDWRRCRRRACAEAPDDRSLDAHAAAGGSRATAFTRLIRRGGRLYVQYWLYYPDSNSVVAAADRLWERSWLLPRVRRLLAGTADYPGFHRDDWEGVFLRIDPDGTAWMRTSSHGHQQGCKWRACRDRWVHGTGWARVSRWSHSGHVPFRSEPVWQDLTKTGNRRYVPRDGPPRRIPLLPGRDLEERSSTGEGLRLIPLETLDQRRYRPLEPGVKPPWQKEPYTDPESDAS